MASSSDDARSVDVAKLRAARQLVGIDLRTMFSGQQLAQSEIMRRLAENSAWRIKDIEDIKFERPSGPRRGFKVRLLRPSDSAVVYLHFVHVIDELYRLVWTEARDAHYAEDRRA